MAAAAADAGSAQAVYGRWTKCLAKGQPTDAQLCSSGQSPSLSLSLSEKCPSEDIWVIWRPER
jgi:hypothetical protein